ncbi:phage tail protein I [Sphingomonas oryzagri]|uniref:Phage tail protein I n=1 Tax=Sphingomonas oryzagri TaxID=3042314 RepID=A0ABT6N7T1_9SPHN|nr:phage tail protein I [Sphingomonas oryzagri]MDH7641158.1 phage tail protein I [Sphingomonas oryzagri]
MTLQPSNAPAFQRALAEPMGQLAEIPVPLRELWNPATMPIELLPWLAWALNVDRWDTDWTEAAKRQAVADAIPLQRKKGTVASVEAVLTSFDELLTLTEWFDQAPQGEPGTFTIDLPLGADGGARSTAAFAEAIIRDVTRVKPVRAHFQLYQSVAAIGQVGVIGAARALVNARIDGTVLPDTSQPWDTFLQTANGEPLQLASGEFLEQ